MQANRTIVARIHNVLTAGCESASATTRGIASRMQQRVVNEEEEKIKKFIE